MRLRYLSPSFLAAVAFVLPGAAFSQPVNDDFANAIELVTAPGQTSVSVNGTNVGATREADEPPVEEGGSYVGVWYKTVPVATGTYTISINTGGTWDSYLSVFEGTSLEDIVLVGLNDDDETGELGLGSRLEMTLTAGRPYYFIVDGFNADESGPFTFTVAGGELLPVELVAFTGAADGSTARLTWETASETNNAGFVVEHLNGAAWADVGRIAGHGTTTERHAYAFDVPDLTAGTHRFRLRQTDLDGTANLSNVVTVEVLAPNALALTVLGQRGVRVEAAEPTTVEVVDMLGRRVYLEDVATGTSVVHVPTLPAGAYMVRAMSAGRSAVARMLVR